MTTENKEQLIKRFKAFLWYMGMMGAVALVDFAMANIGLFNLPPTVVVIIGGILGQVSKWLNTRNPQPPVEPAE